jgi:aspartate-semialdehyde dehydrogenase
MAFSKAAIIGSTGLVGLELLLILEDRPYEIEELRLFASDRSEGKEQIFRGEKVRVEPVEKMDLNGLDVVFFMAGADISRKYVPIAVDEGILVVDNSSAFRRDPDIPLVVPEVNPQEIKRKTGLIANPNCTVIQLVAAIHPIHSISPIKRLVVSTYQSISGAGSAEWEKMIDETDNYLAGEYSEMAFNLWPGIDRLLEDGYYYEEEKVLEETRKILGDSGVAISATTVRVPVLRAHSISVYLETLDPVDIHDARTALEDAQGLEVVDNDDDLQSLSPVAMAGKDPVRIGRLRKDRSSDRGMLMWIVADNLRKGAGLNALQIAEYIYRD